MKTLMIVVAMCVAAAGLSAAEANPASSPLRGSLRLGDTRTEGEKKLPPPQLAGFALGEKIDVHDKEALAARNLSFSGMVQLAQVGYTHYECEAKKPIGEYKSVIVDVSTNKQVVSVFAVLPCKDKEESAKKAVEIHNKLKADFAGRLADPAPYILSVTPDGDVVDIEFCTAEFKSLNDRNNALASGAK